MPIIPATWEAEAGELLEPGRQSFTEARSRCCTPVWATRAKLHLKKNLALHNIICKYINYIFLALLLVLTRQGLIATVCHQHE